MCGKPGTNPSSRPPQTRKIAAGTRGPRSRNEQRAERRQKGEQLQLVVCGEVQSA